MFPGAAILRDSCRGNCSEVNDLNFFGNSVIAPISKRRLQLAGGLICLFFIAASTAAYFLLFYHPGIDVTVDNTGRMPIRSLVLVVTGNRYALGDIPPGGSAQATVQCTGDSHLEIEMHDAHGRPMRLDAGGFFQSGYRGTIRLSIKDGEIDRNEQDIKWYPA